MEAMQYDASLSQQRIIDTGSVSGFHRLTDFGYGYLTQAKGRGQPLCRNEEGWGPFSPYRYDLTPCALDATVAAVAVYGVLFGAGAIYYLYKWRKEQEVKKDWHFWTKQVLVGLIAATVALQLAFQVIALPNAWFGDIRFWTSILTILSLGVIFHIQWIEHSRLRNPNGVVLFYWLLLNVVFSIKLRSLIAQKIYQESLPYFVAFCVCFGLSLVEFALEWLVPKRKSAYDALGDEDECPVETATVFSILTFSWMTPMMAYGYKEYLTEDDLWNLAKRDTTKACGSSFEQSWEHEIENKEKPNMWIALFRSYGGPFYRGALFKVVSDTLAFIQPQLLRLLIAFVGSYGSKHPQPVIRGVAISLGMFAVSVGQTLALHQYFQRAFETGMRIKTGLTAAIYGKSLKLSNEGRQSKSTGDIVNLMSTDTQRLQDLTQYGQQIWSAPYQITLCMISLYRLVGLSMFAGVAMMILMVPINGIVAKFMKTLQKRQMKNKDSRTRLIAEIINNMKSIKLYAWGQAFMNKLNYVRNDQELKTLRQIGAAQSFANFTWSTTPFLVSCSTFAVFVLTQDEPLTVELVFPALTLFNLLTFPLAILPMVITSIIEASVAVQRLTALFTSEEIQPDAVDYQPAVEKLGDESISIIDGTFTWNRHEGRNALKNIDFSARKGELSCIVGRVGSGKSSFLGSCLGDLFKVDGKVTIHGSVAYVAQQAWVMNATVRENIVFGHRWDPDFYNKTIKACALIEDFGQLPDGDNTEVGERGISLSGGQKARLTLARAVYARADVYLLDDCLSAVDQHVGRHLIDQVFGSRGLLAGKTRVLATNSIPVLNEADFIALLKDGEIVERGTLDEILARDGDVANLIKSANQQDTAARVAEEIAETTDSQSDASTIVERTDTHEDQNTAEAAQERLSTIAPINSGTSRPSQTHRSSRNRTQSNGTLRRASTATMRGPRGKLIDEEGAVQRSKQSKENIEQGKVKWKVYLEYAKEANPVAVAIYLITLVGAQTTSVYSNVWLKQWSEENSRRGTNENVGMYIGIYLAFGVGSAALVVVQTLILWIFCSIEASRKLHERMAHAIFRSPMSFFDTTPAGRILNRFSADIYRLDEVLSRVFNMLFVNSARAIFTLIVISASAPAFVTVIIPLAIVYFWIQRYYLRTSRELKRLDSVTKSPVYAHFQETLGGLSTVRAFKQQKRFAYENEFRVDANLRAYHPSISANRWLAVRLEFIGSLIILAAALFSSLAVSSGKGPSPGLVGLAMSYALSITQSLNWLVRQTVEVETNIVSVERVLEYSNLPSEAAEVITNSRPPIHWPAHGAVEFKNYSTKYREGLDPVLKNIDLDIKPHEKIGVVGRTGAGKSSLTLALFRIVEPLPGGNIAIDNLNTSSIGLLDLRSRLAIIPQDAALFEGTVRDNLDPGGVHDDTELWSVLEHARLKDHVSSMGGGLDARIQEGGSNLSQGQRQLVSLARALLTPTNILVLDEATAAVDVETDAMLQKTLRSPQFSTRTIITIAHRINTILDSDRILVLDAGRVAEFDTPEELVKRKGLFWELVKEAGLLDGVGKSKK